LEERGRHLGFLPGAKRLRIWGGKKGQEEGKKLLAGFDRRWSGRLTSEKKLELPSSRKKSWRGFRGGGKVEKGRRVPPEKRGIAEMLPHDP